MCIEARVAMRRAVCARLMRRAARGPAAHKRAGWAGLPGMCTRVRALPLAMRCIEPNRSRTQLACSL